MYKRKIFLLSCSCTLGHGPHPCFFLHTPLKRTHMHIHTRAHTDNFQFPWGHSQEPSDISVKSEAALSFQGFKSLCIGLKQQNFMLLWFESPKVQSQGVGSSIVYQMALVKDSSSASPASDGSLVCGRVTPMSASVFTWLLLVTLCVLSGYIEGCSYWI